VCVCVCVIIKHTLPSAGVEWVDIRHRKLMGVNDSMAWACGTLCLPAIAYFVTDWRLLTVAVTAPLGLSIFLWRHADRPVHSLAS